jgi:hypothetical protein
MPALQWTWPPTHHRVGETSVNLKSPSYQPMQSVARSIPTLTRRTPIGLSIVAIAVCFLFWPTTLSAQYWFAGVAATLLVLDVSRLHVPAPGLATLGDWSYALYLCHLPAFLVAIKLAPDAPLAAGLLGAFGAAGFFGTLDVWLYKRLKTKVDRSPDELRKRSLFWFLLIFCAAAAVPGPIAGVGLPALVLIGGAYWIGKKVFGRKQ